MREAIRHLEAKEPLPALLRLLKLWPTHRNAAFAEQVDRLGSHLDRSVKPIAKVRRHASWMQRFGDNQPADLWAMMKVIDHATSKELKARIDALLGLAPDPRTTTALLAWGDELHGAVFGPFGKGWTALLKVAVHVGDPRMRDGLLALCERMDAMDAATGFPNHTKLVVRIQKALAKMPAPHEVVVDPALVAAIDAALAGPAPGKTKVYQQEGGDAGEIQALIYADPMDDGPIQVWADMLQDAGDELGTWISLQLGAERKAPTQKVRAAERRFRKANTARLLGPLAAVVDPKDAVFRRGVLYAARVALRTKEQKQQLRQHEAWRSVVQVQTEAPHLRSGALPNVRRYGLRLVPTPFDTEDAPPGFLFQNVAAPSWTSFATLAAGSKPLPLTAACTALPAKPTTKHLAALKDLQGMPNLEELQLSGSGWDRRGLFDALGALTEYEPVHEVPTLVLDGLGIPALSLVQVLEMVRRGGGTLVLLGYGFCHRVQRDDAGLHLLVRATETTVDSATELLRCIADPSDWASITVQAKGWSARQIDRMEKAMRPAGTVALPRPKKRR